MTRSVRMPWRSEGLRSVINNSKKKLIKNKLHIKIPPKTPEPHPSLNAFRFDSIVTAASIAQTRKTAVLVLAGRRLTVVRRALARGIEIDRLRSGEVKQVRLVSWEQLKVTVAGLRERPARTVMSLHLFFTLALHVCNKKLYVNVM